MLTRWDNIKILRAIDASQEQYGGGPSWMSGRDLMDGIAGPPRVTDHQLIRGFVHELHLARDAHLLTFRVDAHAAAYQDQNPDFYLQNVREIALTVAGQDRARGRLVVQPLPDPAEDDGRLISSLILRQVGEAIEANYSQEQLVIFLCESGVPLDELPGPPDNDPIDTVHSALSALDHWGSEGRRILRRFVGSWLDDRLLSGPDNELRAVLIEQLARQGWYVKDGNLVIGEPARGIRASSPILRDARIAALHPDIAQAVAKYLQDGHRGAAVFEAAKIINNRVKSMTTLTADGARLMGTAFSSDNPHLILGDLSNQTGRDVQDGYRFLFMGVQEAIRNPSAHEPFADMDDNEAFELLGLASHLIRQLDRAKAAT